MVDARDLKSLGFIIHAGSIPAPGIDMIFWVVSSVGRAPDL